MLCRFILLCFCLLFVGHVWSAPKRGSRFSSWFLESGIRKARSQAVQEGTQALETKRELSSRITEVCDRLYINNYPVSFYVCSSCADGQETDCMYGDCPSQQCADFVVGPNDWCAKCPNGPNCWVENRLIPMGNVVSFPNGTTCNCVYGGNQVVRTLCSYLSDGVVIEYFHGPEYVSWV
ncbi:uncharacterized protein LOC106078001 [Biomphalaria glabrata]|uniref:Uncharacterized protein LOC106078001 n=1 Tax=Biomphalaria glabrata TaxID=6526 RepID=A0A9U8ELW9_BIOGL|nr:uncharacterized protein LOC106078001 [Biomphalaria glabrata]